jgi:hypothetical protein
MAASPSNERHDPAFSQEFAGIFAAMLKAMDIGPVELRDERVVVRVGERQVIYVDVRAVTLEGPIRIRRPKRRGEQGRHLRLVRP